MRASTARPSTWRGTSRSRAVAASPRRCSRSATTPSGSCGDTNLSDLTVQGSAPQFAVTSVQNFTTDQNPRLLREVQGTFTVPCYLTTASCAIGGGFNYSSTSPDATPTQQSGNVGTAQFDCIVPRAADGSPGAGFAVRPRAARFADRGPRRQRPEHGGGAQLRVLRHRLVGARPGGHAVRHQRPSEPQPVPGGRRQAPAGRAEHAPPGAADCESERLRLACGVPAGRKPALRHLPPLLRRQQPGRDHGRHHDRRGARLHPRRARRHRHGLRRGPPPAEHRLHAVRQLPVRSGPGRRLHRLVDPPADARSHAAALGPRRGRRLRGAHDLRPAARHARPQGADAHRLRRPPGEPVLRPR